MRFEVQFLGCVTCGGDHWWAVDTHGQFKPEGVAGKKDAAEKIAVILNERWEQVKAPSEG
jgi:hypothetical protein